MSPLFNILSRFVIDFLPRSKHLLISWLQSPSAVILEPKKRKCHCFYFSPIYLPWSDGTGCHDLLFWTLSFKPTFSLSSFTFIKRLFSFSSLSAIRVVSSAYLRFLILLLAILISAKSTDTFSSLHPALFQQGYYHHIRYHRFLLKTLVLSTYQQRSLKKKKSRANRLDLTWLTFINPHYFTDTVSIGELLLLSTTNWGVVSSQ